MPRTLPDGLADALENMSGIPYIKVWAVPSFRALTPEEIAAEELCYDCMYYRLHNTELEVKTTQYIGGHIAIERGMIVNGVKLTIISATFTIHERSYSKGFYHYKAGLLPIISDIRVSTPGDVTYEEFIPAVFADANSQATITFLNSDAEWLDYQVYPAGRTYQTNNPTNLFNILRQKYLIFATENGQNDVLMFSMADDYDPTAGEIIYINALDEIGYKYSCRTFIWRDENASVHTSTPTGYPLHNLGFMPTGAHEPQFDVGGMTFSYYSEAHKATFTLPPNLTIQTGDMIIPILMDPYTTLHGRADVEEIFDPSQDRTWQTKVSLITAFVNTEGGAMPSSIESAAPYTPVQVSHFNNVLSSSDNNLQAALETLDDHGHIVLTTIPPVDTTEAPGFAFWLDVVTSTFYVWSGSVWVEFAGGITPGTDDLLTEASDILTTEDSNNLILE